MTITVKFPAALEADLRRHADAQGLATSLVVREAVAQYLLQAQALAPAPSAAALGADLFGQHSGPADLAAGRKAALAGAWADKHARPAAPGQTDSRHAAAGPPTPAVRSRRGRP